MRHVTYGPGGFDPVKPNVAEEFEVPDPEPQPLTEHEQLATLLAVKGVITTDEAAAVTKRAKADLVAEAEAWAVAAEVAPVKP